MPGLSGLRPAATVSYMSAIVTGPSADVLAWWRDGERTLHTAVEALPDPDLAGPSLLPGWSRQTLLAHLARNADALVNLLTWARTGVETPMYASAGARDEEIAETAARPASEVRAEFAGSQAGSPPPSRNCPTPPGRRRCGPRRARWCRPPRCRGCASARPGCTPSTWPGR